MPHRHSSSTSHHNGDRLIHSARLYDAGMAFLGGRATRLRAGLADAVSVGPGDRALDVGSGTGDLALELGRRVGQTGSVIGVDPAPEMVARASTKAPRAGLPVTFQIARGQQLPFPDASFDVVTCTLALHHIAADDRQAAINEICRVLQPGGQLLIADFQPPTSTVAKQATKLLLGSAMAYNQLDEALQLCRSAGLSQLTRSGTTLGWLGQLTGRRPQQTAQRTLSR